ncbi:glutamine ABC transporter ATP-binding protein [Paucilactobacillus hokkaidonensis JCM 18461]|uniref:Glutamine ABC transporter ATP-binding protein n=2 Tax=Paucilactobacillus hokkaidonensis TaxID=1193095 RepID=A0A0A1GXE4_9LACO|nr:amino acid ABC transporter ATP-binding protein [Paucilactobacillus hokkaidonensis]KRO10418.1 phosphate ABC transporter ATP-binding protein [Paucilactobacillus hokkaidonensis]BAP86735.1 glutamine ABC transporter ATP-binding protein [Paucilactobacillus hokkaidonensis JCM 18461]
MAEKLLTVSHLNKNYGKKEVLHDINFSVDKGSVTVILGPSGSGKSTMIRCLNGLEDFHSGQIDFKGQVIQPGFKKWQPIRQNIGMVFQSYDLFPNRTVIDNILLGPLKVQKRSHEEALAQARQLLKEVQLTEYENVYPRQLSGGQKQRIAIVRALELNPEFILFDEVTASLDPEMVRGVLDVMLQLAQRKMTMIVVTHEMNFAKQIADNVIFLEDGKIIEKSVGRQFFDQPKTERAKEFLNSMDF